MVLKFKKPEAKQQRIKILVFGEMGSGKSTLACSFPNTAYFDTEDTTSKLLYANAINKNNGAVINSGDIDEIINQVRELMSCKHDYKTIVVDSLTVAYENALIEGERKVGSEYGRHIAYADGKAKQLVNLLLRADMNCVVTCQSKREYGDGMKVIGNTYVGYKRLGYIFDLVLETSVLGKTFEARVRKSRFDSFPMGEEIPFNYDEIIRRCNKEAVENVVQPIILANAEQVKEVKRLVELLKVDDASVQKWLTKAQAESFEEMDQDLIVKCINSLQEKIKESK